MPAEPPQLRQDAGSVAAERLLRGELGSAGLSRLTDLAARLLSVPGSAVTVQVSVLTDVQTVAAAAGEAPPVVGSRTAAWDSLCSVTAAAGTQPVGPNAPADARVATLTPVTSGAVGAYLGVPLLTADGACFGALCAYAREAREWSV